MLKENRYIKQQGKHITKAFGYIRIIVSRYPSLQICGGGCRKNSAKSTRVDIYGVPYL